MAKTSSGRRDGDRLRPGTAQFDARQARHRHNSYRVAVAMMRAQAHAIATSPTATPAAKELARRIGTIAEVLAEALRERVERDGTTTRSTSHDDN